MTSSLNSLSNLNWTDFSVPSDLLKNVGIFFSRNRNWQLKSFQVSSICSAKDYSFTHNSCWYLNRASLLESTNCALNRLVRLSGASSYYFSSNFNCRIRNCWSLLSLLKIRSIHFFIFSWIRIGFTNFISEWKRIESLRLDIEWHESSSISVNVVGKKMFGRVIIALVPFFAKESHL